MPEPSDRPVLPHGAWPSPISVAMAVAGSRELAEPLPDGDDLYYLESRPEEAGRVVLVHRAADGALEDVVPGDMSVRTRVHEYGGGAYTVRDGVVVLSEFAGNRLLLRRASGADLEELVSEPALRFADMHLDPRRERVIAVLEDQRESAREPRNLLCAVSLRDGSLSELVAGHDFFSDPRLDVAGARLAWLTWDRPSMPWDGSDLWVADVAGDGSVGEPRHVAGGPEESIVHPVWSPDGSLLYASDRTGWWNLYRWRAGGPVAAALAPMAAECAGPQWVFGLSSFDVDEDGSIVVAATVGGRDRLLWLTPGAGRPDEMAVETPEVDASSLAYLRVRRGVATFVAGSPVRPTAICRLERSSGRIERLREGGSLDVPPAYLSVPRHITFPSAGGRTSHAWFYPPTNPAARAPEGDRPPLVIMSHGGPTSSATTSLSLGRQVFTSRGFAVVDVDYGGSTGYGRPYRRLLDGGWGEVDVEDCVAAARWLAEEGLVDGARLAIRGGSAGGFTTLAALCRPGVFAAGTSYYGVGDLEALARDTHKFESRYLDRLVAPYPDRLDVYRERSPIHRVERIRCPVLVLQGADDLIVPRAQADEIVAALGRNGVPHAYLLFEGEGHGFRQAGHQQRALEAELSFYAQVFGFRLADDIEPLAVVGLEPRVRSTSPG
jgi:dipeptidyl aminopeptidase/acylaminoacyl peptidase